MGIRSFAARYRKTVTASLVAGIILIVFVLVWFQPQKLFIDTTVKESAPSSVPTATTSAATQPSTLASGSFRSLEHRTTGRARLIRLADGALVLRLEDLDTSNGPLLKVYLSRLPADRGQGDYGTRFLDLGTLKGNRGDQNYSVPTGTDPAQFRSVVIWCKRFAVGFGVAPLA